MSKLADRFYRWLYGKPLDRFFQEYWQKTDYFPLLLNELVMRVKRASENRELFTNRLQTDPILNEMVLAEFLAEGVLTNAFLDWLGSDTAHMQEFLSVIFTDHDLQTALLSGLQEQGLIEQYFVEWLKEDMSHARQFVNLLEKDEVLKKDLITTMAHKKFVSRDEFIRWINNEPENLLAYLQFLERREENRQRFHEVLLQLHIPQAALTEWMKAEPGSVKRFVNQLAENDADLVNALEEALFHFKTPTERFLQWLAMSEANPRKFNAELRLSSENRELLFVALQNDAEIRQEMNQALWQNDRVVNEFLDHIARDDEKRKIFLRELGERENFRSVLRVMHDQETLSKLTYALPTLTSSFPRSGSNFFQSVLRGSSGLQCISLYHSNYPQEQVFNLKSHALTPAALRREFADMVPYELEYPEKIIYLKRDPRDVMISLYEFACFNHQRAFSLDEFLGMNYYFVANPPGVRGVKTIYYLPGPEACTVEEAFSLYHQSHLHIPQHESTVETLTLSYEEMVEDPQSAFDRAFAFLDLDCPLNPEFIHLKVSLYSDSTRKRGIAYGWRQPETQEHYAPLLEQVNDRLKDEIIALGYEAM
jgi:hypothetical protein